MAVFSEPPKAKTVGLSIGELLAEVDRVTTPDEGRCPECGKKVHPVKTEKDSWYADEQGDAQCYWEGGTYGHQHWHGSGWVDEEAITEAYERLTAAVRKLPRHVLGLLGE